MSMNNKEITKTLVLERLTLEAKLSALHEVLAEATDRADIHIREVTRAQLLIIIEECTLYIEEALKRLHKDTQDYTDLLTRIDILHNEGLL